MTKAAQIMALWAEIPDGPQKTRIIAELVHCRPEYVRVVARQRKGLGVSEHDRRYLASSLGRLTMNRKNERYRKKYWSDGEWREHRKASSREWKRRRKLAAEGANA